jgi:hypothetical protein
MVFGPAGVLYSLVVDIKPLKASLRCFNNFGWCIFKESLHLKPGVSFFLEKL